ncbi:hypothetical protein FEM48_ZijujUnG0005400 [Ziziphus jujuba var. spinosa]|uniref:MLO-like protein n=1 Tax=Ziziphus jujuba var. spinosa TaxID=714518 RepID=A0A978UA27_ZIZJJ|nr:hypothetical protein FEM48_ZijujUnG0005400 [Ziziphus jujuba var. spinosa]
MEEEPNYSLEYTPTWVVASVCFFIVLISLCAERSLHHLGKILWRRKQEALFEALQKLKEELMLLGFISLLLTVFQGLVSHICIPTDLASYMLPCKRETPEAEHHGDYTSIQAISNIHRRLLSEDSSFSGHCLKKVECLRKREGSIVISGSITSSTHFHLCTRSGSCDLLCYNNGSRRDEGNIYIYIYIFFFPIFSLAQYIYTIREWKHWEDSVKVPGKDRDDDFHSTPHKEFRQRAAGQWRNAAVISWIISFFKQFHGSVSKADYISLRRGFIKTHFPHMPDFDFHAYIMRTLEVDFKRIVGISSYLWLFVVLFLLINLKGKFMMAHLLLVSLFAIDSGWGRQLLLLVGAKLEHIINHLAKEAEENIKDHEAQQTSGKKTSKESTGVKPSDKHFWFHKPRLILFLIHFILFQNSFEIAFFFWILCTYGFHSCIMEKLGFIITRLIMGAIVQVLCCYITLPLYALVIQMGSTFMEGMFGAAVREGIGSWTENIKGQQQVNKMEKQMSQIVHTSTAQQPSHHQEATASGDEITRVDHH